jgi:prepilin-type N-terminal cleavage/methylation domain-containing protein
VYRNRERGFSLLEIMVSLAVLGILAAVAAAGFREYVVRAAVMRHVPV